MPKKTVSRRMAPAGIIPEYPDLLTAAEAAEYLGRSVYWMSERRTEDRKKMACGLSPNGPAWHKEEGAARVLYRKSVLRQWIEENILAAS